MESIQPWAFFQTKGNLRVESKQPWALFQTKGNLRVENNHGPYFIKLQRRQLRDVVQLIKYKGNSRMSFE